MTSEAGTGGGDPKDSAARTLYKEGFGLFAKGQLAEAIARYRAAIAADPGLAIAWNGLSLALAKQGDLDAAIDAAEKLVSLEPDDPLSHTNLSRILMQKGLIPEAEDAKARATSLQMRQRR
ncbi:MAG: tetratricopeptide repeat protein [Myxococcota bacterium]